MFKLEDHSYEEVRFLTSLYTIQIIHLWFMENFYNISKVLIKEEYLHIKYYLIFCFDISQSTSKTKITRRRKNVNNAMFHN